jgi:hypothetical protein
MKRTERVMARGFTTGVAEFGSGPLPSIAAAIAVMEASSCAAWTCGAVCRGQGGAGAQLGAAQIAGLTLSLPSLVCDRAAALAASQSQAPNQHDGKASGKRTTAQGALAVPPDPAPGQPASPAHTGSTRPTLAAAGSSSGARPTCASQGRPQATHRASSAACV